MYLAREFPSAFYVFLPQTESKIQTDPDYPGLRIPIITYFDNNIRLKQHLALFDYLAKCFDCKEHSRWADLEGSEVPSFFGFCKEFFQPIVFNSSGIV